MNGSRYHLPDPTPILVHIAGKVGKIEAKVEAIEKHIDRKQRRPLSDYMAPAIGAVILAAAAAGKITWQEALPSILGLVGGK